MASAATTQNGKNRRPAQPAKLAELINHHFNGHATRPTVASVGYVEPILGGWAHLVIEPSSDTGSPHGKVFLGPQQAAGKRQLAALTGASPPVAAIVNCTNAFPNHHDEDGVAYCRIAVNDEAGANILAYFEGAAQFIHHHIIRGESVLVHCQFGVSRSASVVMAYLMRYASMSVEEAYVHVKERRPMINPNPGFWMQLRMYAERLEIEREGPADATIAKRSTAFGQDWAEISLATYQTIGHIVEDPVELFQEINADCIVADIMFLAVDFLFGRGVLEADLPWLSALCASFRALGVDPLTSIDDVFSEGSDFMDQWSGEVYRGRIGKIVESASTSSA